MWRDGAPVFPSASDSRGHGLSDTAYEFIAGILDHAGALQGVIGPTVNSYKRTGATGTASGATWSPNIASVGGNDRTHFLRIPDGHRVELRGSDGSANPYLATAATIAAGLDGIERHLDAGVVGATEGRKTLPATLLHAMDELESDPVIAGALDAAGPGVCDYFVNLKRAEFFEWHNNVTPWELDNYLTAF
jgi:glutamine synthetase